MNVKFCTGICLEIEDSGLGPLEDSGLGPLEDSGLGPAYMQVHHIFG